MLMPNTDRGDRHQRRPKTAEPLVEYLPDDFHAEVLSRAHRQVELLLRREVAVLLMVAAVHAPQFKIVCSARKASLSNPAHGTARMCF
jgi:hypothetical protein